MAGDWIKMRHDLPDDPAVIGVAARTGLDEDAVIGKLLRLWSWADRHTVNGDAPSVTLVWIDRHVGATGFASALVAVGWLEETSDGIRIPKFDAHISESAKQRALTARRNRKLRDAKRDGVIVTNASTREEKRREDKAKESTNVDSSSQPVVARSPSGFTFPLQTGTLWDLSSRKLDEYRAAYGDGISVEAELRKAKQWLMDNPGRRPKAGRGMKSFLTRWLGRACDFRGKRMDLKCSDDEGVYNPETGEIVRPFGSGQ